MGNKTIGGIILLLLFSCSAYSQVDTILNRYKRLVMDKAHLVNIDRAWLNLDSAYRWTDIDYDDTQPAYWKVLNHLGRVSAITMVWCDPQSVYFHDRVLWQTINQALDHWLKKRYRSSNWWHNEIGIPQIMRNIIVLLRDSLTPQRLSQSLEVMAQYRLHGNSTGANLVWSADLGLHYGALTGDTALMRNCLKRIWNEIRITTKDGIQPDYSFHQHDARLQMYQYGRAFLRDNIRLAWQLQGTAWSYPVAKTTILTNFMLEGWQWMARGIHTVPGTMDRSVSRVNELRSADIRDLAPMLHELNPQKRAAFQALVDRQNEKGPSLKGFRYFPYSDFAAYHQEPFSFFVKTISDRTLATESINNENLKGKLLNSGDAYVIRNGNEYFNLMPVWDWNLLPGVTGFKGADHIIRQPFVGSVGDGKSGATTMDYQLKDTGMQLLTAKKLWACHNNQVVCLIAGLQKNNIPGEVFTALDQCRWQDDVTVDVQNGPLKEGDHHWDGLKWIHHAGLAYIFLQPAAVDLHLKTVTGKWQSISRSGPAEPVTEKICTPVLLHAETPAAGYVLASCTTAAQAISLASNPAWQVLRNDTICQAVRFHDNTCMVVFYSPGSVIINKKQLTVEQPCLILIRGNTLYASDPSQKQHKLTIRFNKAVWNIPLPDHGRSTAGILLK